MIRKIVFWGSTDVYTFCYSDDDKRKDSNFDSVSYELEVRGRINWIVIVNCVN